VLVAHEERPIVKAPARAELQRASGVLLHLSSLPGPHGNGDLGSEARAFVDFLAAAGQTYWQLLPVHPTGPGNSPYSGVSAFAGNPLFIDLEQLVEAGLLSAAALGGALPQVQVDYDAAAAHRRPLLREAFAVFRKQSAQHGARLSAFRRKSRSWLPDYALFMALKDTLGGAWTEWDAPLRDRSPAVLSRARKQLAADIAYYEFEQLMFDTQWQALRSYAAARKVRLIGDVPIFVAHDSADVWAHRSGFQLDSKGQPTHVSGVPPDYFSETGQLWGTPLYAWAQHKREHYRFWIERLRAQLDRFDWVRLDHFIGFARYWQIPADAPTAQAGRWRNGPGRALFDAAARKLGALPFIAEDLGAVSPEVERLRDDLGFPGMRVLQFAFDSDAHNLFLPHNYPRHAVAYTGTHDNDTMLGWLRERAQSGNEQQLRMLNAYLGRPGARLEPEVLCGGLIRLLFASVAKLVIVPMQDLLGLGSEARMNVPGRAEGNWTYRLQREALSAELTQELLALTQLYGRTPPAAAEADQTLDTSDADDGTTRAEPARRAYKRSAR
jgi:4-alpha-glucanotransferase